MTIKKEDKLDNQLIVDDNNDQPTSPVSKIKVKDAKIPIEIGKPDIEDGVDLPIEDGEVIPEKEDNNESEEADF